MASELKRLQLQVAQAEAVARLQVVQTEINARTAEMRSWRCATGSATRLLKTDREVLRKMRHGDDEPVQAANAVKAAVADEWPCEDP